MGSIFEKLVDDLINAPTAVGPGTIKDRVDAARKVLLDEIYALRDDRDFFKQAYRVYFKHETK